MLRGIVVQRAGMRAWLIVAGALLTVGLAAPEATLAVGDTRTLSIYNVNTKERLTVTYKKNGRFVPAAMAKLDHIMRDWRRDQSTKMDPTLIDLIWELHASLGSTEPVHLISGYRSARTNASLRARGGGQARQSRHILGKAADIHFPDIPVKALRNSALIRERGGVGYYPGSSIPFVHVDTDFVRHWPRLPRQELAMLFPTRETRHLPKDGRPLTERDRRIALAALKAKDEAPVMVARAEPPSAPPLPAPAPAAAPAPQPMLASLTPAPSPARLTEAARRLPWLGKQEAPSQPEPAAPAATVLASVDLGFTAAFERPRAARMPPLDRALVSEASDVDSEHPEELSYQPYPVLALITAGMGPSDHELLALDHPEQDQVGALLLESARRTAQRFDTRHSAEAGLNGRRFAGGASHPSADSASPATLLPFQVAARQ